MANSKAVNLEKQVECPICLEQYKEPKVLSCLHSYCKSCLQKYVTKSGDRQHKIACPECRQETQVPDGDVDKLQVNFWVNNLIGFLTLTSSDEKQKPLICENCNSGDPAVSHCTECCVFMCDFCVTVHQRLHSFIHHQIVPLEEVKSGSPKALIKPVHCEKHCGEVVKLFCQTCDKPICRDCAMVDHQGHKYVFVVDAVSKEKDSVRNLLEKTKIKVPGLADGVKSVEEMEKGVQAKVAVVNQQIDAFRDKQIKAFEEIIASLKHEANTLGQAKLKQLQAQREGLMIALASVNNSIEFTERILQDGGDVEILSMKKQLVTNLSKLNSSTWDCKPCQSDGFQLTVHRDIWQVAGDIATVDDFYVMPETCTVSLGRHTLIPETSHKTCVGERIEVTVWVLDNHGKRRSGQKVCVSVAYPGILQGQENIVQVTDRRDGSYCCAYTPPKKGHYWLNVVVFSQHIQGSPFKLDAINPKRRKERSRAYQERQELFGSLAERLHEEWE